MLLECPLSDSTFGCSDSTYKMLHSSGVELVPWACLAPEDSYTAVFFKGQILVTPAKSAKLAPVNGVHQVLDKVSTEGFNSSSTKVQSSNMLNVYTSKMNN